MALKSHCIDSIIPHTLMCDNLVAWVPYNPGHKIVCRFSRDTWHGIVTDIDSDKEWAERVASHPDILSCYVLLNNVTGEEIGFCFVAWTDSRRLSVSIHGGGWMSGCAILYMHALTLLVNALFTSGLKIRSCFHQDNKRARRLLSAIGFRPYRYDDNCVYSYINQKLFIHSLGYQRVFYS